MDSLADQIEAHLLQRRDWVPAAELVSIFGVRERELMALDDRPGLCSLFAISGNKGYKHIAVATDSEWSQHYGRERKHNIGALVTLRAKRQRRDQLVHQYARPPLRVEQTTGQILLLEVPMG